MRNVIALAILAATITTAAHAATTNDSNAPRLDKPAIRTWHTAQADTLDYVTRCRPDFMGGQTCTTTQY